MTVISTHQASLLPYSGFWAKLAASELHGITTDVKLDYAGYQNRVPLGNGWLTIPVSKDSKNHLIKDVATASSFVPDKLIGTIKGRLPKKQYPFLRRLDPILEALSSIDTDSLCAINCMLTDLVARELGLRTNITITKTGPYEGETKHDRLFERIGRLGVHEGSYLAGGGTASYLEADRIPKGWEVLVQECILDEPDTGQSVVHFLAKYEDPLTEMTRRYRFVSIK